MKKGKNIGIVMYMLAGAGLLLTGFTTAQSGLSEECRGEYEKCPNSALALDLLEEMSKILVPLGVYNKCFYLSRG